RRLSADRRPRAPRVAVCGGPRLAPVALAAESLALGDPLPAARRPRPVGARVPSRDSRRPASLRPDGLRSGGRGRSRSDARLERMARAREPETGPRVPHAGARGLTRVRAAPRDGALRSFEREVYGRRALPRPPGARDPGRSRARGGLDLPAGRRLD